MRGQHVTGLLSLLLLSTMCADTQGATQNPHVSMFHTNITAFEGGNILLPCHVTAHVGVVTWIRPNENTLVAQDYDVMDPSQRDNMRVVGHPSSGEYSLLIKYVNYRRDHGQWICGNTGYGQQVVNLTVVVPPAEALPVVTPTDVSTIDLTSEAWTFTCSAHFAYPPVDLTWVKVIGHDIPFDVTPTAFVMSPMKTVASSVKLVLSAVHAGSVFACQARHPAYLGQVYTSNVHYALPPELQARAMAQLGRGGNTEDDVDQQERGGGMTKSAMSGLYHIILIVLSLIAAVIFLVVVILVRTRKCWELDVKVHRQFVQLSSRDPHDSKPYLCEETVDRVELLRIGYTIQARRERAACKCRVVSASLLAVVLVLSLSLAVPTYLMGITIPPLGTDAVTSVLAGSALWLDCSQMALPLTSLIQVNWRKNTELFYHQYLINGQNIGYPDNSTLGHTLGTRVTSQRPGQINMWPMMPQETDAYTCEVALMADNSGRTRVSRFTTAVIVTLGPVTNWALLALLGVALAAVLAAIILTYTHAIRCLGNRRPSAL